MPNAAVDFAARDGDALVVLAAMKQGQRFIEIGSPCAASSWAASEPTKQARQREGAPPQRPQAAEQAAATARTTFEEGALALSLPKVKVDAMEVTAGLGVLTAFVKAGLVASTGEARRQVKGGGLRVNDTAVTDERATLGDKDFEKDGVAKLSLGKKKHVLLERA